MENYIILKWGSLKAYNFSDDFVKNNKKIVEELNNIWDKIYNNRCSAISGSEYFQQNNELKNKTIILLKIFFDKGVIFQNGFTDEYYNTFDTIKDYILNYGG